MTLERVKLLLEDRKCSEIADLLESRGLHEAGLEDSTLWNLLVLSHILNDQLELARFACKRAPDHVREQAEHQRCFKLLQLLWNREYKALWTLLDPSLWTTESGIMIQAMKEKQRQSMIGLITRSYSTIKISTACELLGCSSAELQEEASKRGWVQDQQKGIVFVKKQDSMTHANLDLSMLKEITEHMIALDH